MGVSSLTQRGNKWVDGWQNWAGEPATMTQDNRWTCLMFARSWQCVMRRNKKNPKQTKLLTYPLKKVCGMGMFGLFHKSYIPKHENKSLWLCLWHIWPFGKVFWWVPPAYLASTFNLIYLFIYLLLPSLNMSGVTILVISCQKKKSGSYSPLLPSLLARTDRRTHTHFLL